MSNFETACAQMTDDELVRKQVQILGKINIARQFMSQDIVNSLLLLLEEVEMHISDRMQKKQWEILNQQTPKIIDSEASVNEPAVPPPVKVKPSGKYTPLLKTKAPTSKENDSQ